MSSDPTTVGDWDGNQGPAAEALWSSMRHAAQHIVLISRQGVIIRINGPSEKVLGKVIYDFMPADDAAKAQAAVERIWTSGEAEQLELRGVNEREEATSFQTRIGPLAVDGVVVGLIIFGTDIGAQREAEASLRGERKLLREQLEIQDRDRHLLAYELHDGLIQDVVGAQMLLESLSRHIDPANETGVQLAKTMAGVLSKAIDEGRRLISELRPMMVAEHGLQAAIEFLIKEEEGAGVCPIQFDYELGDRTVLPIIGGTVFRIIQESLANVRKHSQAHNVAVEVRLEGEKISCLIRDDGCGFDPQQVAGDRLGLKGVRERARLFGGQAEIRSQLGQGTTVEVTLPLVVAPVDDPPQS